MHTPRMRTLALLSLLATSGCTLLVGAELANKPDESDGGGGGTAEASSGASTTSTHASSVASTSSSTSASSSSGLVCAPNTANCDGIPAEGCNVNLMTDALNCGTCHHVCLGIMMKCTGGACK